MQFQSFWKIWILYSWQEAIHMFIFCQFRHHLLSEMATSSLKSHISFVNRAPKVKNIFISMLGVCLEHWIFSRAFYVEVGTLQGYEGQQDTCEVQCKRGSDKSASFHSLVKNCLFVSWVKPQFSLFYLYFGSHWHLQYKKIYIEAFPHFFLIW